MSHGGDSESVEQLRVLAHLTSAVGHHVINAFSSIVSHAELLRAPSVMSEGETENLAGRTEAIVQTGLNASVLTRRLIEFSRQFTSLEAPFTADSVTPLDLNQVIADTVETERSRRGDGVSWNLTLSRTPLIRGDSAQLRSMLCYLIENAVESLPNGWGTITITTKTDARDWLVLELRDSGAGMSPEILERAIEPFFSTKADHLGIGLSIAVGIWRRHRGTLSIESHPGEGTTLCLSVKPGPVST